MLRFDDRDLPNGLQQGVQKHYDLHKYESEKRALFTAWNRIRTPSYHHHQRTWCSRSAEQGCSTLSIEFPVEERIGSGESGSISILTEC